MELQVTMPSPRQLGSCRMASLLLMQDVVFPHFSLTPDVCDLVFCFTSRLDIERWQMLGLKTSRKIPPNSKTPTRATLLPGLGLVKAKMHHEATDSPVKPPSARSSGSTAPSAGLGGSRDLCLFYAYTSGCAKQERCEYCHVRGDQTQGSHKTKTKIRPEARARIRTRLLQCLVASNLYSVHDELQEEARKSPYALEFIRSHLENSRRFPRAPETFQVLFSLWHSLTVKEEIPACLKCQTHNHRCRSQRPGSICRSSVQKMQLSQSVLK